MTGPKENVHMVNRDRLKLMKKNAVVINVDRPPLVDETAMAEHLRENPEAVYVMDDYPKDPYLLAHILYTPHIGGSTPSGKKQVMENTVKLFTKLYQEYLSVIADADATTAPARKRTGIRGTPLMSVPELWEDFAGFRYAAD